MTVEKADYRSGQAVFGQILVAPPCHPPRFLRLRRGIEQFPTVADRHDAIGVPMCDKHRRADIGNARMRLKPVRYQPANRNERIVVLADIGN